MCYMLHTPPHFTSGDHTCVATYGRGSAMHIAYQEDVKDPAGDKATSSTGLCKIKKFAFLNDEGGKTMEV
jgi:hypothetical protein